MVKSNFESDVRADPYKTADALIAGRYPQSQISFYHIDLLVTALAEQISLSASYYPKSAEYLDRLAACPSLSQQEIKMIKGARERIKRENLELEQKLSGPDNTPEPG